MGRSYFFSNEEVVVSLFGTADDLVDPFLLVYGGPGIEVVRLSAYCY